MSNTPFVCLLAGASLLVGLNVAVAAPPSGGAVRLYCNGVAGAGFVHGDRSHVVTAFAVVRSGRPVDVVFADGQTIEADTVAVDREHGVALLKLESPAPIEPLGTRSAAAAPGAAIQGVFPAEETYRGPLPAATVPGTVVAVGEHVLRVALPSPESGRGAPVVDASGALVGLVRRPGAIAEVVPAERVATLVARTQAEPDTNYRGEGVFAIRTGWLLRADEGGLSHGPRLSMDLVAFDRFGLAARIGTLFGDAPGGDPEFLAGAQTVGMVADLELNGRFGITADAPLQIVGGLGMTSVRWGSRGHVVEDGALVEAQTSGDLTRPYARLALGINDLVEFGYSFEVDVEDPARSAHRFGLTIGF